MEKKNKDSIIMKQFFSFILFQILLSGAINYSYCSNNSLDSLKKVILLAPDDTVKVLQLKDLSFKYLKIQLDTSFILNKSAIKLSKDLNFTFGYASALNQMGLVYKYMAEYDSALFYYKKSLLLFDSLNINYEIASVLNRMGNVYKRSGQFDQSLECFMNSIKIYQDLNDSIHISYVLNNLGILYYDMGEYDKSLEYQFLNLEIKNKLELNDKISVVLMNIGNIYNRERIFDKAIEYYKQALEYLENSDYKYDRLLLLHNIGVLYEDNYKFQEAMEYYNRAVILEKEINDKEMLVFSLQGVGNVLIKMGNFNEGIKYLENSYALANQIGDIRKEHKLSKNLYEEYENHGDYKKGFAYLKKYVAIEDSIFNLEGKKQIAELEQKYEAEKREQQIAFLEKEQAIQKLELSKKEIKSKQKSFQRNVLILVSILAISLLVYYLNENKKRKRFNSLLIKQNKKIIEQRTEIAQRNDELIESNKTKDNLFQIIAHDLRSPLVSMDSIAQLIPYWVEEQDYKSLKKLSKTLELSVNNVLSLIDNLLNWALNQQGKFPYKPENLRLKENIIEAIEVYRPIAEIKNIDLKFTFSKDVMVFADKNMLFTVMRNLLNNAIKFTPEKGNIIVGIDNNQQFAKVWVKDSGIGIPKEKRKMVFELANGHGKEIEGETGNGLGLFFCKEFVTMNNGDIFIESEKGKGTTITFTLPLFNMAEN